MAHREFVGADGTLWEMWDVHPTLADRRSAKDPHPPAHSDERRKQRSYRSPVPGTMKSGWLALQSATERRRIAPVPDGWSLRTDEELRALVRASESTGKRRRLIE
jgi:hypothetical protein